MFVQTDGRDKLDEPKSHFSQFLLKHLKLNIKKWDGRSWNVSCSEYGYVEGCFENDNELSGFTTSGDLLDCMRKL